MCAIRCCFQEWTLKVHKVEAEPSDTWHTIRVVTPLFRFCPGFGLQSGAFPVPITVGCGYDGNTVPEIEKSGGQVMLRRTYSKRNKIFTMILKSYDLWNCTFLLLCFI